jgi:hypothetical protein
MIALHIKIRTLKVASSIPIIRSLLTTRVLPCLRSAHMTTNLIMLAVTTMTLKVDPNIKEMIRKRDLIMVASGSVESLNDDCGLFVMDVNRN